MLVVVAQREQPPLSLLPAKLRAALTAQRMCLKDTLQTDFGEGA